MNIMDILTSINLVKVKDNVIKKKIKDTKISISNFRWWRFLEFHNENQTDILQQQNVRVNLRLSTFCDGLLVEGRN